MKKMVIALTWPQKSHHQLLTISGSRAVMFCWSMEKLNLEGNLEKMKHANEHSTENLLASVIYASARLEVYSMSFERAWSERVCAKSLFQKNQSQMHCGRLTIYPSSGRWLLFRKEGWGVEPGGWWSERNQVRMKRYGCNQVSKAWFRTSSNNWRVYCLY